jgi:hypothetical protein
VSKNLPRTEPLPEPESERGEDADGPFAVPDLLRRFAALGLSGFFTTESALRKALGDTVPQDWVDFAAEQSERTRAELLERVAQEFSKMLEEVDVRELMDEVLDGHTIEIEAKIKFSAKERESTSSFPAPANKAAKREPSE